MIIQGLKLTLLGMMVVFSFLILLLIIIHLSAKLLKPFTKKEASALTSHKPSRAREKKTTDDNLKLTAIISAAISAHRSRIGRYRSP
ncbi:MAG: OadG family protein [Proteobacteria bacterium]|nr:OadG family protein [Pseudomonadota bacterium]MBU1581519.1 OadG family protein [Pseudomonadota bacterium]MBU2454618.1 OadG family protein [Pseudomonadota bacterium]MBU2628069.1 OadG family protein [Pseudomonadota bacterium]